MTTFNCNKEISQFHDEEVTLGERERRDMRERRNAGRIRLRTGLEGGGYALPIMTCSQGSYQMRTMVQDDACDYDIDDGAYFRPEGLQDAFGQPLSPGQARQRVCDALTRDQRFASPAKVHDNCVRQEYQAGYHIDVPVYRVQQEEYDDGQTREILELASKEAWIFSDARAVTKWFLATLKELNGEEGDDGNQMRRIVRLTKSFARSHEEWKEQATSGITISKLVVDEFQASPGRDDLALVDTWKLIEQRLRQSTAVEHPINPSPLAAAGNAKLNFFQRKLSSSLKTLEVLENDDCTRNEARAAWDSVFNTTFISELPDPNEPDGENKAFFVATESKSDKRDDGNGRYGAGVAF